MQILEHAFITISQSGYIFHFLTLTITYVLWPVMQRPIQICLTHVVSYVPKAGMKHHETSEGAAQSVQSVLGGSSHLVSGL